ncbi:MAG: DoxX family protein [Vicingaceae bacterium]
MKKHLSLIGRILLSAVFIVEGLLKVFDFERFWHIIELKGMPVAPLVAILVVFIELGGGIAILIGFYTRFFAPIMAVYLFVVTLVSFPFWSDMIHFDDFIRNMAIVGGLIIEDFAGAGPESVDDSHFFDT